MAWVGEYELLDEIGRGGTAAVFRARDTRLGRDVALKLLLTVRPSDPSQRQRFRSEAEVLARVQHPNVVPVHAVGEHEGRPFLVMALIEGETLQARLDREGPLAPRAAVELLAKLARGVEQVHACGVLHRDVKPANVLIDRAGEPILTDFGLARDALAERLTQAGTALGTPGYWSPEQAVGDRRIGPPTDVYGLGATLHAALVGRPPGSSSSFQAAPVVHLPGADHALEEVCARCLRADPASRYPDAGALAADLERWLAGEPVQARAPRSRRPLALLGLAGLAGGGLAVAAMLPPQAVAPPPPSAPAVPASAAAPTAPPAPDSARRHERAMSLYGRGDVAGAVREWDALLREDPRDRRARNNRGVARRRLGDFEGSLADLRAVIEQDPSWPDGHNNVGMTLLRAGDFDGAIAACSRAIELQPAFQDAHHQRGLARAALGRLREAEADFSRALLLNERDQRSWYQRARTRVASGDLPGARADARKAVELGPSDQGAQELLRRLD